MVEARMVLSRFVVTITCDGCSFSHFIYSVWIGAENIGGFKIWCSATSWRHNGNIGLFYILSTTSWWFQLLLPYNLYWKIVYLHSFKMEFPLHLEMIFGHPLGVAFPVENHSISLYYPCHFSVDSVLALSWILAFFVLQWAVWEHGRHILEHSGQCSGGRIPSSKPRKSGDSSCKAFTPSCSDWILAARGAKQESIHPSNPERTRSWSLLHTFVCQHALFIAPTLGTASC